MRRRPRRRHARASATAKRRNWRSSPRRTAPSGRSAQSAPPRRSHRWSGWGPEKRRCQGCRAPLLPQWRRDASPAWGSCLHPDAVRLSRIFRATFRLFHTTKSRGICTRHHPTVCKVQRWASVRTGLGRRVRPRAGLGHARGRRGAPPPRGGPARGAVRGVHRACDGALVNRAPGFVWPLSQWIAFSQERFHWISE